MNLDVDFIEERIFLLQEKMADVGKDFCLGMSSMLFLCDENMDVDTYVESLPYISTETDTKRRFARQIWMELLIDRVKRICPFCWEKKFRVGEWNFGFSSVSREGDIWDYYIEINRLQPICKKCSRLKRTHKRRLDMTVVDRIILTKEVEKRFLINGSQIQKYRIQSGLSVAELAKRMEWSRIYQHRLENGCQKTMSEWKMDLMSINIGYYGEGEQEEWIVNPEGIMMGREHSGLMLVSFAKECSWSPSYQCQLEVGRIQRIGTTSLEKIESIFDRFGVQFLRSPRTPGKI